MTLNTTRRIAAFFDLDHTLLSRSSGELYIRVMRERGLLSRGDLWKIFFASLLYRVNLLNGEDLMEKFTQRYRGEPEQEMIAFCEQWFEDTVKGYLYTEAVSLVREHREQGHVLALLTAATPYVSVPAGRYLGIDSVLCTRLEVDEKGLFTGRLVKPLCHGTGKVLWAKRFCEEQGLDLAESYFYTDSIRDLPVLEEVRYPVPVNPDFFLRRQAGRNRWDVKRFEKTLNRARER